MRTKFLATSSAGVSPAGPAASSPPARAAGETPADQPARTPAVLVALALTLLATIAHGATLVVLPFDNVSGAQTGPREVAALLAKAIESKGWTVSGGDTVEPLLEQERVRYLDSIDQSVRKKIVEATGAAAIVSGALYTYADGRSPVVALAARMVRADGTLAWADVAAVGGDDTAGLCGFGKKTTAAELAAVAVESMARRFPRAGEEAAPVRPRGKSIFMSGPLSFRAQDFDPATPHRVCVLPLENEAGVPEAARVVADILTLRLAAANGFEVVEPARLRAAALDAHIGSFRNIASEDLSKLGRALGTTLFLRGTVFDYDEVAGMSTGDPKVDVELSLVDVGEGRVLWTAQHERRGNDYVGFLMLGAVTNAVSLTDRVVSEMISAEEKARSSATPSAKAARGGQKRVPEKHSALRNREKENDR